MDVKEDRIFICQDNHDLMPPAPYPAFRGMMGRGIDGVKIFNNKKDREDFLVRLADLCGSDALSVYAWALMSNHFHLLLRTGNQMLSNSMRKILTGYVVNYNRRHKR